MADPKLPHQPPLRLLTRIDSQGSDSVALALVAVGSPAEAGGWIRSGYLIEIAAQAVAAHQSLATGAHTDGNRTVSGMLTAVRHWRHHAAVRAETIVEVLVQPLAALGNAAQFHTTIRQDGQLVAAGTLQVIRTLSAW